MITAGTASNFANNPGNKAGFDATQASLGAFFELGQLIIAVRAGSRARIAALALAANTSDIQTRTAASALGLTACAKAVEPRGAS